MSWLCLSLCACNHIMENSLRRLLIHKVFRRTFFTIYENDGVRTMRLVLFVPTLRSKLKEAQKGKGSMALQTVVLREVRTMMTWKFT